MTTPDPNVQTNPDGSTVVLEPGDPGYVAPANTMPPAPHAEGEALAPVLPVEPPQDLTFKNEPGQDASEAILAHRGEVVESLSPTDIVPNTPQIRPFPVEAEPEAESEAEPEPEAEPETVA